MSTKTPIHEYSLVGTKKFSFEDWKNAHTQHLRVVHNIIQSHLDWYDETYFEHLTHFMYKKSSKYVDEENDK